MITTNANPHILSKTRTSYSLVWETLNKLPSHLSYSPFFWEWPIFSGTTNLIINKVNKTSFPNSN
jgi:hypothetical protein